MEPKDIITRLQNRIDRPLSEFSKRRIIFWKDEERQFFDNINEIKLSNASFLVLNGNNFFEIKKILNEKRDTNFVIYDPFHLNDESNWLIGTLAYSEEFRSDIISEWMNELRIPSEDSLREIVKENRSFFKAKSRREKFELANVDLPYDQKIYLSMLKVITKSKSNNIHEMIRNVFLEGLNPDENSIYNDLRTYGLTDDCFWNPIKNIYGIEIYDHNLKNTLSNLILSSIKHNLNEYELGLLGENTDLIENTIQSYDFIKQWLSSGIEQKNTLKEFIKELDFFDDEFISRIKRLDIMTIVLRLEELFLFEEIIIDDILRKVGGFESNIYLKELKKIIDHRKSSAWYMDYKEYYDILDKVLDIKLLNIDFNFKEDNKISLWESYERNLYKVDRNYRLFNVSYNLTLKNPNEKLENKFRILKEQLDNYYDRFLNTLSEKWTKLVEDDLNKIGYAYNIERQEQFYKNHIEEFKSKVYVIISDALRYEVATSLKDELLKQQHCKINLSSMQSILPSITKFGMAALLPHKKLNAKSTGDSVKLLSDSLNTDSQNRQEILKRFNENSVALKYKDLVKMSIKDRKEFMKGQEIVYIYHDTIDHTSHVDEDKVFEACDKAIDEIKHLIKMITNEFGGINIFVTSDHGFIFKGNDIKEYDKVDVVNDHLEYGRRYLISKNKKDSEYLMPIKFFDGDSDLNLFLPFGTSTMKIKGSVARFFHGGITIQEMMVPLLKYKYVRKASKEFERNKNRYEIKPVEIILLSSSRKINNMSFSLDFYQRNIVSENRVKDIYNAYFIDDKGIKISDTKKIIADRKNKNEKDRIFRISFNFKQRTYESSKIYYLIIENESKMIEKKIEFTIEIAQDFEQLRFF